MSYLPVSASATAKSSELMIENCQCDIGNLESFTAIFGLIPNPFKTRINGGHYIFHRVLLAFVCSSRASCSGHFDCGVEKHISGLWSSGETCRWLNHGIQSSVTLCGHFKGWDTEIMSMNCWTKVVRLVPGSFPVCWNVWPRTSYVQ